MLIKFSKKLGHFVLIIVCSIPSVALSQQNIPTTAETGRIFSDIEKSPIKPSGTIIPPTKNDFDAQIPRAEKDGFTIQKFLFLGAAAFSKTTLDTISKPYLGQLSNFETIKHLAKKIENHYKDNGYFLTRVIIPEQEITNKTVTLKILETHISEVHVSDTKNILKNDYFNIFNGIKKRILATSPIHGPTLERYALILNDLNISAQFRLSKSQKKCDKAAVDLNIILLPLSPSINIGYNNHGSRYIGTSQASLLHSQTNNFNSFDRLSGQIRTTIPTTEMKAFNAEYSTPLTSSGLKFNSSITHVKSHPGHTLTPLEIEGNSTTLLLGLSYPIVRTKKFSLFSNGTIGIRNSFTEFLNEELVDDKIRSLSLDVYGMLTHDSGAISNTSIQIEKGLDILNASQSGNPKSSRNFGDAQFLLARLNADHTTWLNDQILLSAKAVTQFSNDSLLSSNEFGVGGKIGRAYDMSEITGDKGASMSVELQSPKLITSKDLNINVSPFIFYDIGKVWHNNSNNADAKSLASAGMGTHFTVKDNTSGTVQLAYPLTHKASTPVMNGNSGPRLLFNMSLKF